MRHETTLVLDAMGVMYQPADDVADLLIPYARAKGCGRSDAEITQLYRAASRGSIDSATLWARLGFAEDATSLDREFSAAYTVTDGLGDLLRWCADAGIDVACISNDLGEWAAIRARHFGLSNALVSWTISATVGARKPEMAICQAFRATVPEHTHCVFVDDRLENVAAVARCGMHGVLFAPRFTAPAAPGAAVDSLPALIGVLNEAARSHRDPEDGKNRYTGSA